MPAESSAPTSLSYDYLACAKLIDHALLMPTLTERDLETGIDLALAYDVASVCIMPYRVKRCAERLAGSTVVPSTTIGFPHGAQAYGVKRSEAQQAIDDGCIELDMVVNISQVLSENWSAVEADLRSVIEVAHAAGRKVKVIFENCYLQETHKIRLCQICYELKADWVKTSTGFGTGGATIADLVLMKKHSPAPMQVKAAGGVRDFAMLLEVRALGVSRIGSSKTKELLDPCRESLGLAPINIQAKNSTNY